MKILGVIIMCFVIATGVILFKNGSLDEFANVVDDKIGGLAHSFTDSRDGKSYRTVTIGTQTWMAENLNYAYNHATAKSFCYDDLPENCRNYGRLYNRAAAIDSAAILGSNERQGVCPNGWRLPSVEDWEELAAYIGRSGAGIKLKSKTGWNNGGNGTDEYDFSVVPAGFREKRKYKGDGFVATFWTLTVANNKALEDMGTAYGNHYVLTNNSQSLNAAFWISAMNPKRAKIAYFAGNINGVDISNATGSHSIRCIKNDGAEETGNTKSNTAANAVKKVSSNAGSINKASKEIKRMFETYIALQEAYFSEVGSVGSNREIGLTFRETGFSDCGKYFVCGELKKQKGIYLTPKISMESCSKGKNISISPYSKGENVGFKCKLDSGCESFVSGLKSICGF